MGAGGGGLKGAAGGRAAARQFLARLLEAPCRLPPMLRAECTAAESAALQASARAASGAAAAGLQQLLQEGAAV